VDLVLPKLRETLRSTGSVVLTAEPGTGKTTRVPPALLDMVPGEILVLEPRRLAAKLSAARVADERGERLGDLVGYQFRFENVSGPRTRLRYLTEGMLMRRLLGDPSLKGVGAVVLDEFHERHLHGDVALAYLKMLQAGSRRDLKLVVMSATLDAEGVAGFLDGCPIIRVEGKRFEVKLEYQGDAGVRPIERRVRDAVTTALDAEPCGDLLVFLAGMADIRRCEAALATLARERDLVIAPLHGELSRDEQDLAVGLRATTKRKVILATNIAETSLTIPGVRIVIDSGLVRVASHSPWSGLAQLRTRPISKASAIQRMGRAGRTAPGRCIRLYSKGDFEGRAPYELPEIQRADLARTLLELHALGVREAAGFEWFEAPTLAGLQAADELLYRLGALSEDGALTSVGEELVSLPLHPRLGRLCVEGMKRGILGEAARVAAFLSEGALSGSGGGMDFFSELSRAPSGAQLKKVEERIRQSLESPATRRLPQPQAAIADREAVLARCLLSAFPDRVARRKGEGTSSRDLLMSGGGSLPIEPSSLTVSHEWFVVLDAGERQAQGQTRAKVFARLLAAIESDWLLDLKPDAVVASEEIIWNETRKKVEAVSRMAYGALVLDESRGEPSDLKKAGQVLANAVISSPAWKNITEEESITAWIARSAFLKSADPAEVAWPDLSEEGLRSLFREYCVGKTRGDEVVSSDFAASIRGTVPAEILAKIERWAPTHVQLSRGRRVRINYEPAKPPWIESRLQDFFGMKDGPKLLGGRVPLTIHLLAPNQRAVQVTSDLAGFWERIYPGLRRELGRRYPRHAWPEDPFSV